MKVVWRIAAVTPVSTAEDMSGAGARLSGGRWNSVGVPMVYAAESIALTVLETLVHLRTDGLPMNRYLVEIHIPRPVWRKRTILEPIPAGWDAEPKGYPSMVAGNSWKASHVSALLVVPSVIVPEESNVLINPEHPDAPTLRVRVVRKWMYDVRLF